MKLALDGHNITSLQQLHREIAQQLELPDYYGENLDALWDVLTEWSEPLEVTVQNSSALLYRLGEESGSVLQLLQEAEEENAAITVNIEV